jgi:ABC-2 type transport system ATP-binding protein
VELVITNLSKTYANGVRALAGLSLTIPNGMFGLLGPNGAGKSTLMRTVATLQRPDAGTIHLGTLDVLAQPDAVRKLLGYLPQEFGLYPNLSAEMVLDHFASLKGVIARGERKALVDALLQQTNLYEVRAKRVGGFSGGMKQRLGIAIALAGQPQLLIVDEPTAGLDPTERRRFLNLLADISEDVIVILSTHIVDDVRELCQRMAIINQGQVVLAGDPREVIGAMRGRVWSRTVPRADLAAFLASHNVISTRLVSGMPAVHVYSETDPGGGFAAAEAGLEDVYFHRIGALTAAE